SRVLFRSGVIACACGRETSGACASGRDGARRSFRSRRQRHAHATTNSSQGRTVMAARDSIGKAIEQAHARGEPALVAYITAGFPKREAFRDLLGAVASAVDLIEVGVPFTDPMADGATIQRSNRAALEQGVTLKWILSELKAFSSQAPSSPRAPVLLMSYLNPLLACGLDRLPDDAARAGVAGFIVPDLPYEECAEMRSALDARGL